MSRDRPRVAGYDAIGFDLVTALLRTWPLWEEIAADAATGQRWHAASQALLRGLPYHPFEENLHRAAAEIGLGPERADEIIRRWVVAGSAHDVGGASRAGMDVYWANRGGVPASADATALREEPGLAGLLEILR